MGACDGDRHTPVQMHIVPGRADRAVMGGIAGDLPAVKVLLKPVPLGEARQDEVHPPVPVIQGLKVLFQIDRRAGCNAAGSGNADMAGQMVKGIVPEFSKFQQISFKVLAGLFPFEKVQKTLQVIIVDMTDHAELEIERGAGRDFDFQLFQPFFSKPAYRFPTIRYRQSPGGEARDFQNER